MDNFIKRLTDLLKIKNIVTLMAMTVFTVLALNGGIDVSNVMLVIGSIIAYFFNKDVTDKSK